MDNRVSPAYDAWCAKRAHHGGTSTSFDDFCSWFVTHVDGDMEMRDACRAAWDASSPDHTDDYEHFEAWADAALEGA